MGENLTGALSLLAQKKDHFAQYERLTIALSECTDTPDIEKYITLRAELATKIDETDNQLKRILSEYGEFALAALSNRCERGDLSQELYPIFDRSQEILSIVHRIQKLNQAVTLDFEHIKAESLEKIKSSKDTVKVNRYLTNLTQQVSNNFGKV